MTNFTGSITGAATTTIAATTVRTQMQTTIPTNSAWSLVESTTMSAGSVPCDVYKCAAAGSGLSADFYVAVLQNGANLYLGLAEGYNTSTHRPRRPAMIATSTAQTLQSDGGVITATQELDWWNGTVNPGGGVISVAVNGSGMQVGLAITDDYMIVVAKDALMLFGRVAAAFNYAGAYDTNITSPATNDPLPIVVARASATFGCFATRMPLSGGASRAYACNCNGAASADTLSSLTTANPPPDSGWMVFTQSRLGSPAGDQFDKYGPISSGTPALKMPVLNSYTASNATSGREVNGWLRGWFRHVRYIQTSATPTVMDTCTVDGVGYTLGSLTGSAGLWFETNPA